MSVSTDLSTSATRVIVKYNEVDRGKSGTVGKSVKKSCQKVEELSKVKKPQKSKNLKGPKSRKGHWLRRMFTKTPIFC